jgi:SpoVK/Ycf46/Vps4 family AAA+-type ATPase
MAFRRSWPLTCRFDAMASNLILWLSGRKHCGKTYLAARIARRLYDNGRRVLCVSPMGGFDLPGAPLLLDDRPQSWADLNGRSAVVLPESDAMARDAFLFAWEAGNLWLFVDEIDMYLDPFDPDENLMKVIRYGRHKGISLCGICQRPAAVRKDLLAQADLVLLFQTVEPNDLRYLKAFVGADPQVLSALPERRYLVARMSP